MLLIASSQRNKGANILLKKMLIHGLIAAAVIGGAAAVFASGRGDGYAMDNSAPAKHVDAGKTKDGNNGYITTVLVTESGTATSGRSAKTTMSVSMNVTTNDRNTAANTANATKTN